MPRPPRLTLPLAATLAWLTACADAVPSEPTCDQIQCDRDQVCVAGTCRDVAPPEPDLITEDRSPSEDTDPEPDATPEDLPPEDLPPPQDLPPDAPPLEDIPTQDIDIIEDITPPTDLPPEPDLAPDLAPDLTPDLPPEDQGEPDLPPDEPPPEGPCATARAEALPATLPVDIIWFVDNSGSMDQEEELVEDKINDFARFITRSRIDYRVVMITSDAVCVPAPLSGGGCPDRDADRYRHIRRAVDSHNGLELVHSTYPQYRDFLRPNAQTHIVGVTDDNARWSAGRFLVEMTDLTDPGVNPDFKFHSIVAYGDIPLLGCCGFQGCGAAIGQTYLDLSQLTGGVQAQLCDEDWDGLFQDIAQNVVEGTILPCQYEIPTPEGEFEEIDPDEVNVFYTPPGQAPAVLPNVDNAAACAGSAAWYYDDPTQPTTVILCPNACGFQGGDIEVEFGCDIVKR